VTSRDHLSRDATRGGRARHRWRRHARLPSSIPAIAGSVTRLDPGLAEYRFRVGDVTDDRGPDIVLVSTEGGHAQNRLFAGNGDGTFVASGGLPPAAATATDVVLTDLDADGAGDFITFVDTGDGIAQELHWFRDVASDPEGVVLTPFTANEGLHFAVADLDGDGTKDLIGGLEQNLSVRRGRVLSPSTPAAYEFAGSAVEGYVGAGGAVQSVQTIDANGDGRPDLLCALDNGRVSVVANLGLSSKEVLVLAMARVFPVGAGAIRLATGDFNADGIPDIAAAEPGRGVVTVLLSRRSGAIEYRVSQVFAVAALADIAVVDRTRDGLLDLAALSGAGTIEFWFGRGSAGRGDGGFRKLDFRFPARLKLGPVGDFDRDGLADIVAGAIDQGFTLQTILSNGFEGQGDATFSFGPSSQNLNASFRNGLALGDVDDNGSLDLILVEANRTHTLLQTAPRTFSAAPVTTTIAARPGFADTTAVILDFDGDGVPDLIASNDGGTEFWQGTGEVVTFPPEAP